ncbi:MAG: DUF1553 domain-containing protein [Cyclobacteriaceae bacterium]
MTWGITKLSNICGVVLIILASSCNVQLPDEVQIAYSNLPQELDFNLDIKPILSDKCYACHGPDEGKIVAGLQLHAAEKAYSELSESPGKYAIVPGKPHKSEMAYRILSEDPEVVMPNPESHLTLSAREKAILIKWIEDGAEYEPHWAFMPLTEQAIPEITDSEWSVNPIDNFIAARLEEEGLTPSKEANKEILLRRLFLDLTGLPPTGVEIQEFLTDTDPNAYEKQVDKLLASSHYGEKMATDWMDLARFTDTHGYTVDRYRDMSPWRDWVIKSFNENQPYDEFITWQIAGDLLPDPTREQRLATGFGRLHPQNMEGGIVDEEFRVEYVAERTQVVGQAFMGLTMNCARCHDHKYDPISQKNFYEIYSFFNNVNETGQISWDPGDIPVPNMLYPNQEQEQLLDYLDSLVEITEERANETLEQQTAAANDWVNAGGYQDITINQLRGNRQAHFDLNGTLINKMDGKSGKMDRQFSKGEEPNFVSTNNGKGLKMDGDAWLDLKPVGIFDRSSPFSIGIWVNIPEELEEGVIFHKNKAVMLHCKKGYSLYLKDNKLELILAHTWPDNAIEKVSLIDVPKDEWIQLTLTYDGSSTGQGANLYLNGEVLEMETVIDNLYKEIVFDDYEDVIYAKPIEPGIKVGARWRGTGIKDALVDDITVFDRALTELEVVELSGREVKDLLSKSPAQLSDQERSMLVDYYLANHAEKVQAAKAELRVKRKELNRAMEEIPEVMVMKEMAQPRQAYLLERGQYSEYGEEVFPNTPESIMPFPEDLPKNRLGLAKWLVDPRHPLTARVTVNRYWQQYFGRGIVKTTEDFGNQGELPSHRELIDWLAMEFINSGWDVKALQKLIVMSATYRQTSITPPDLLERDAENVLLARGPKFRLTSEMMRDNALGASGLLNDTIGGPSVKPYQPPGLWKMNGDTYVPDDGTDLYRRGLYTYWKRTVPLPTQATFDQPERSECAVRRQKTNTPLQALVLLNDPTFVEVSRKMGEDITKSGDLEEGIRSAFVSLTGREVKDQELQELLKLQAHELEQFEQDDTRSKGWIKLGQYEIDPSLDVNMVAANAVVANVILNLDATITRR